MPIIKIVEKGFERYNGEFGAVSFVDGVSTESVSNMEAERLGSSIRIKVVEEDGSEGQCMSASQRLIDTNRSIPPAERKGDKIDRSVEKEPVEEDKAESDKKVNVRIEDLDYSYTLESLSEIADKGGIKELRAFSEPYGIRSKAISDIVEKMMTLKESKQPANEESASETEAATEEKTQESAPESDAEETASDDVVVEGDE